MRIINAMNIKHLHYFWRIAKAGRPAEFRVGVSDAVSKTIAYRLLEPAIGLSKPVRVVYRQWKLDSLLVERGESPLPRHFRRAHSTPDERARVQPPARSIRDKLFRVRQGCQEPQGKISHLATRRARAAGGRPHSRESTTQ